MEEKSEEVMFASLVGEGPLNGAVGPQQLKGAEFSLQVPESRSRPSVGAAPESSPFVLNH
jgi:hypothetical protein